MARLRVRGLIGGAVDFRAQLETELSAAGILTKLDALHVFGGDEPNVNIVNPGTNDVTTSGSPTLGDTGYTGDGTSAFLNTGLTPGGGNYALNDALVGVWVVAHPAGASASDYALGSASADRTRIAAMATDGMRTRLNDGTNKDQARGRSHPEGLKILRRDNSADYDIFENGVYSETITTTSTAVPGSSITYLRTAGAYSTDTIAVGVIGGSLTDDEIETLYLSVAKAAHGLGMLTDREYLASPGVWTWFNDPRAIIYDGVAHTAAVDWNGSILTNQVKPARGWQASDVQYQGEGVDDHNNGAILQRADGKFLRLWAGHNDANYWAAASENANDARTWAAPVDIASQLGMSGNYGYANAVILDSGRIYLFFRADNPSTLEFTWHYSYTDNADGLTGWQTATQLAGSGRPYHKFRKAASGDIIHITLNDGHPASVATNSVYHYYIKDTAGTITYHQSDGTAITNPPFATSELTEVYDGSGAGGRAWVWDIVVDGDDRPVIAFATFPDYDGSTADDHRYYQARWNGSAWSASEVCAAGSTVYVTATSEPFYSGGVITDPQDKDVVYCSREVDGNGDIDISTGVHQIYKYTTADSGATWTGSQLTESSDKCFRPYIAEGGRILTYVTGPYVSTTDYDTYIMPMAI